MDVADLFSGAGGSSHGAKLAGHRTVWAANHWPIAVEAHASSFPGATHVCQDLMQADFRQVPDVDIGIASPACQGHSTASQPKRRSFHDKLRSTAWAVTAFAEAKRPPIIIVENVPAFKRWELYEAWMHSLKAMGYHIQVRLVNATHCDVAQRRKRLFVIGSQQPLAPIRIGDPTAPEPAAGPLIDWDDGDWRSVSRAREAVKRRITNARRKHGERFFSQHVTNHPGVPLHEALRTVTGQDQWVVVKGGEYRPLTTRETARIMSFPEDWRPPPGTTRKQTQLMLGNAVPPRMMAAVLRGTLEAR